MRPARRVPVPSAKVRRISRRLRAALAADQADPEALLRDVREAAAAAHLRYVEADEPGLRREAAGAKTFRYRNAKGARVSDARALARIKALAIPPAWVDVWICRDERGHIQAVGRDARGRKQYRYHPRWRQVRDEAKFGRMAAFGRALPHAYIREISGGDFTAKDFRTWIGTTVAAETLASGGGPPETNRARKARMLEALDAVAARLGNTRAVCRTAHVHPALVRAFEAGKRPPGKAPRKRRGLTAVESAVLAALETEHAA